MSADCWCDYDTPEFYNAQRIKYARKPHVCEECNRSIQVGEAYERVTAKWEGQLGMFKTCSRCVDLREYVRAHVPCFCWAHGNMREQAMETAREWAHETVGLMFGAYRRELLIQRNQRP